MTEFLNNLNSLNVNFEGLLLNIILILSMICVIYIAMSNNLIASIILLSSFSLLMALVYLLLDAPDVSITEASIGACISTVILILAINHVKKIDCKNKFSPIAFLIVVILAVALFLAIDDFPTYGNSNSHTTNDLYKYYIENSGSEIGIPATTTSILANYRGYDTLGETCVILIAAFSIAVILNNPNKKK